MTPLTLMVMMPPRLSGGTVWDAGCGDDCEDPPGVFPGQEVDQAYLPRAAGIAEHGSEGDPVRRNGDDLRANRPTAAEDRALERQARRDAGGECAQAEARAADLRSEEHTSE